jgi:thiamine-phosphate diphosphorylase
VSGDWRLIAVLDPSALAGRDPLEAARAAQAGGASSLQLRHKAGAAGELYHLALALRRALSIPCYLNDRADVAWAAGAAGVHLGQDDIPAGALRALRPPPFRIGLSVGSPAEADRSRGLAVDYWSVGPLYRTTTKADAGAPLGPEGFGVLARLAPRGLPVVAIGGITAENAAAAIGAGAAGVAAISAIFAAPDIARATRALRDALDAAPGP